MVAQSGVAAISKVGQGGAGWAGPDTANESGTSGADPDTRSVTLLPDPEPRPIRVPVISVDDHLIEPADLFEGRMPAGMPDRAPRTSSSSRTASRLGSSREQLYPNIGLNAVVGKAREDWSMEPARFSEMRPGCYDIHARVADMDLNGVWASLCFPSLVAGFCGSVFSKVVGPCARARLRTCVERLARGRLGRHVPGSHHPASASLAGRHRRSPQPRCSGTLRAAFRAVSFPEFPARLGLPSIFSGEWDPFFAACAETATVVCQHVGASGWAPLPSPDPPFELFPTLFPVNAILAAAEWLWSGVALAVTRLWRSQCRKVESAGCRC